MTLQLGPKLALPAGAATETFGILGQRGSGKSNVAVVMAEQMWTAGIPWVAVDPKGDWWGMRSGRDGTSPGLALPVFGGLHGDMPLEPGAGAFMADLIFDQNLTCVLDVSDMSKGETARFLVALFDRLYRRHRAEPTVRHLFLEEAHEYIPQLVGKEEGRLKEAASRIVLLGRSFGLGASLLSQRSARIHKDVLSQVGTLIAMSVKIALDRAAIEGWATEHAVGKEIVNTLPGLPPGEGWVLSPGFLGVTQRIVFARRRTFDSGATPVVGGRARPPATLADVDLAVIKAAMAETIERAKADDPKALRQRIAELERQLAQKPAPAAVDQHALAYTFGQAVGGLTAMVRQFDTAGLLTAQLDGLDALVRQMSGGLVIVDDPPPAGRASPAVRDATAGWWSSTAQQRARPPAKAAGKPAEQPATGTAWDGLGKAERAVLAVLAQHPQGRSRVQLALLTGYSVKSSSLSNALGRLRSDGLVGRGDPIRIEPAGQQLAAGRFEPLPTGQALYEHWAGQLGRAERTVLDALVRAWPDELTRDGLAAASGYSATSSSLSNALGRLRSLELVDGWAASTALMEAIA